MVYMILELRRFVRWIDIFGWRIFNIWGVHQTGISLRIADVLGP